MLDYLMFHLLTYIKITIAKTFSNTIKMEEWKIQILTLNIPIHG